MQNYFTNNNFYDLNNNYTPFLFYHKKGNNPTIIQPSKPKEEPNYPPLKRNTPKPTIINPDKEEIKKARVHLDELEY